MVERSSTTITSLPCTGSFEIAAVTFILQKSLSRVYLPDATTYLCVLEGFGKTIRPIFPLKNHQNWVLSSRNKILILIRNLIHRTKIFRQLSMTWHKPKACHNWTPPSSFSNQEHFVRFWKRLPSKRGSCFRRGTVHKTTPSRKLCTLSFRKIIRWFKLKETATASTTQRPKHYSESQIILKWCDW